MVLTGTDIKDLIASTQYDLGRMKFSQIITDLQDYEVMGRWLKKDKVMFDNGIGIQQTILVNKSNAAKHVGLYSPDTVNVVDLLSKINIPWRHATTNYAIERRELLMNKSPAKIVDLIAVRRAAAMISLAEELEEKAWSLPALTNEVDPYGIPYYVVKHATAGFNGGAPSGHTTVAGLNPTTYANWKNYSGSYATVTKADLIAKIRTAIRKCGFKSPVSIPDFRGGKGDKFRLYMNEALLNAIELVGEQQNENLGKDIAEMDGVTTIRRFPCVWIPYLDADTQNPIYGINHATFNPIVLEGDYLRESEVDNSNSHNVNETHVDLTYNYVCNDRRSNFVIYKA